MLEATGKLSKFYLRQYAKKVIENSIKVRFPIAMSRTEQIRFLLEVELDAIKTVEAQMKADLARLTPFRWDTEEDRRRKQAVVNETERTVNGWGDKARSEADSGSSWSRDSSEHSFIFREGEAFRQLRHISIHGWGGL